jgi:hypothetical protein
MHSPDPHFAVSPFRLYRKPLCGGYAPRRHSADAGDPDATPPLHHRFRHEEQDRRRSQRAAPSPPALRLAGDGAPKVNGADTRARQEAPQRSGGTSRHRPRSLTTHRVRKTFVGVLR